MLTDSASSLCTDLLISFLHQLTVEGNEPACLSVPQKQVKSNALFQIANYIPILTCTCKYRHHDALESLFIKLCKVWHMFSMVVGGQASGESGPSELCLLVGNVIRIQSSMLCWLVKKRGKNKDLLYSFPVIVNKLHRKKVVGRWLANHLPTTHRPTTDHLPTTYRPLTDHLPTTYWPTTDHLLTTCRPLTDYLLTTCRPLTE